MSGDVQVRHDVETVLQKAAGDVHSDRLSRVLALLQAENPFTTVLGEIDNMIKLIVEEGKADVEKRDWCQKERKDNNAAHAQKEKDILGLEKKIDQITGDIEDPKTGLKALIQETETTLEQNRASQKTETGERTEANLA